MTDDLSANLSMPLLMPAQAQKHVTHNEALLVLDALVQLVVEDRSLPLAPGGAVAGQRHIVPAGAGALWGGPDHAVAVFDGIAWQFHPPRPGWRAYVLAEAAELVWQDGAWQGPETRALAAPRLGVNAAPDAVNRLAVASEAVLLNHDGAGHRLTINKAGPAETASLLFQTGFSGRAEMGTAGSDDFAVKVSADGSLWTEALRAEAATGRLVAPQGLLLDGALTGLAVTQSATDMTPGRVTRTGDFGLGSNGAPPNCPDLNSTSTPSGFYNLVSTVPNIAAKPSGADSFAVLLVQRYNATQIIQTYHDRASSPNGVRSWIRGSTGPDTWTGWRMIHNSATLLGPVSQTGGVPTGAVIERGSNANGSYIRWADGTQICTHSLSVTDIATPSGNIFATAGDTGWTFPAAFSTTLGLAVSADIRGSGNRWAAARATSATTAALRLFSALSTSGSLESTLTAIGRWY